jgi:hypothetical protein
MVGHLGKENSIGGSSIIMKLVNGRSALGKTV